MTREEAEARVLEDYRLVLGQEIRVGYVFGFANDWVEEAFSPPVLVRVEETEESVLLNWRYDWIDPYWNVTVLEDHRFEGDSTYVDGVSYQVPSGKRQGAILDMSEVALRRLFRRAGLTGDGRR